MAQTIHGAGLAAFYRDRPLPASTEERTPVAADSAATYDDAVDPRTGWLRRRKDGTADVALLLEGVSCGACVWLLETWLARQTGVLGARVNLALRRAEVHVDPRRIALPALLAAVARVGYRAHPYDPAQREAAGRREGRALLRRTALALLAMMQIMMLALPAYLGDDVALADRRLLEWASLTLALPVLIHCAQPFFAGAWRDLRARRVGMDVPVAVALLAAFAGSFVSTWRGEGATYYDSIAMFVGLLLLARLFEHNARERAARALDLTARVVPVIAERYDAWPQQRDLRAVVADALAAGDVVRVRPGGVVPADGAIVDGASHLDESWLTGESMPRRAGVGDAVLAGAINRDGMLAVRVERAGDTTQIALLGRLVAAAAAARPPLARAADRVAGAFAVAMLAIAAATALYWTSVDPSRALAITFAVLAVSCPCALSLATPAALAAAAGALARRHIVTTRPDALEALARVRHVAFDKTGTLTQGRLALVAFEPLRAVPRHRALGIAAALEHGSEHPLARAVVQAARVHAMAHDVRNVPGDGVEGTVEGASWRLGRPGFVARGDVDAIDAHVRAMPRACTVVALGDETGVVALLGFADTLRPDAGRAVEQLVDAGIASSMLSGDRAETARAIAGRAGIDEVSAELRPDAKRGAIAALHGRAGCVAMVGDGVNDAPALAAADVGIALGSATPLAQSTADLVLLRSRLTDVPAAIAIARGTRRIVRQNLTWALLYNAAALPAAALGLVTPLVASVGMAVSSLVVVANAVRAGRG